MASLFNDGGGGYGYNKKPPLKTGGVGDIIGKVGNSLSDWFNNYKNSQNQPTGGSSNTGTGGEYNTNGGGYGTGGGYNTNRDSDYDRPDSYDRYVEAIERQQREAEEARRRQIEAGVGRLEGQLPLLQQQRDDASRQAYIRAQQAQAGMPQQMAAMGATGGLSETALMQSNAGYQNEQSELANAYINAVSGVNSDIANLQANGDLSIAESGDKYRQQLLDIAMKQQQAAMAQREQRQAVLSHKQTSGSAGEQDTDAYGFKGNDDYVKALRSSAVANWLKRLDENEKRNPPSEQSKYVQRAQALKSAYNQGMFTDAEYLAIAKNWGMPP